MAGGMNPYETLKRERMMEAYGGASAKGSQVMSRIELMKTYKHAIRAIWNVAGVDGNEELKKVVDTVLDDTTILDYYRTEVAASKKVKKALRKMSVADAEAINAAMEEMVFTDNDDD